jgi:hypothetical protein
MNLDELTTDPDIMIPVDRLQVKAATARELLSISEWQFDRLQDEKRDGGAVFTERREGTADQPHRYFFCDEIRLYVEMNGRFGPNQARRCVLAYRRKQGRLKEGSKC